jgi:CBS domain-containing protein
MPIKNIARKQDELVKAQVDTPVRTLAELMRDQKVGCVLVCREQATPDEMVMTDRGPRPADPVGSASNSTNHLAGIVTDRDLTVSVLAEGAEANGLTAKDVMTPDPVTASPDDNIFSLCSTMREHSIRRVPIVDDGEPTGIISLDDIIYLLEGEIDNLESITDAVSAVIENESPPRLSQ